MEARISALRRDSSGLFCGVDSPLGVVEVFSMPQRSSSLIFLSMLGWRCEIDEMGFTDGDMIHIKGLFGRWKRAEDARMCWLVHEDG